MHEQGLRPSPFDVAIIGGGPAGQAAALVLAEAGARVAVLDEQLRPGGQILRQPPREFALPRWMIGRTYRPLRKQLATFEAQPTLRWYGGHSVIAIDGVCDAFAIVTTSSAGATRIGARRILIAAGCYDLPTMVPGWTLPGAMGAGGLQALIKSQGVMPGERIALAGTHPLMLIVATQILAAGGQVAGVMFEQPFATFARAAAGMLSQIATNSGPLRDATMAIARLWKAGIPVRFGQQLRAIDGRTRVERLKLEDSNGRDAVIDCDAVGLCYGFLPQSDLVRQAGLDVGWAAPAGGWAATHDDWLRSSVAGIAVAGETTGVAGAPAALQAGRIAGAGLAADLGLIDHAAAEAIRRPATRAWRRTRGFAAHLDRLADPSPVLRRLAQTNTICCRCEDVDSTRLRAAIAAAPDPNAVKLATRCGMGLCQGRGCEHMLIRMVAEHRGIAPDNIRPFTSRFPARPTPIGDLIA